ncbi:hypothetical protein BMS3Abin05_00720 [bacterium BMS3Abin05]|nr:hypothetical protein BMS3Abin05_00720 [bacterium BMS3Abin05]HDL78541.1 hypothetical protein [Bacteroidota bacterium]
MMSVPKVGIISFYGSENENLDWYWKGIAQAHKELREFLEKNHVDVVDSTQFFSKGVHTETELNKISRKFVNEHVEAILIETYNVPPKALFLHAVLSLPVHFALYGSFNPSLKSALGLMRSGQFIWENLRNKQAITSHRFWGVGKYMIQWIRGMSALYHLRNDTFVVFSAQTDAFSEAEYKFILDNLGGSISVVPISLVLEAAESISNKQAENFLTLLKEKGLLNFLKGKTVLKDELLHQIKFLLAVKKWVNSSRMEAINVIGFDQSACEVLREQVFNIGFLSTFLPFPVGVKDSKTSFPIVGEVDETLLFSTALLSKISYPVSAFSGAVNIADYHFFLVSSPWGAPAYYAGGSLEENNILSNINIERDCETYRDVTPGFEVSSGEMTTANLAKLPGGRYIMQIGEGWSREITPEMRQNIQWGKGWPRLAIDLGVRPYLLIQTLGSPFIALTMKRNANEIKAVCDQLQLPVMRLDSEAAVKEFRDHFRTGRVI